jgi:hypothetical protein
MVESNMMMNRQRGEGEHVVPPPPRIAPPLCPARNAPMTDPYHSTIIESYPVTKMNLSQYQ